ncbi:hypothetical protein BFGS084_01090 [Bacteroides fragilis]|nr:hypothetical protein BFGS084_01090 [Bacteroides fragilis]
MVHTIYEFSLPADTFPFVFTDVKKVFPLSFHVWRKIRYIVIG